MRPSAQTALQPEQPIRDPLPEYLEWRDEGCTVAPRCLECPLVRCRYDEPGGLQAVMIRSRNAAVVEAYRRGTPIDAIGQRFRLSRRSVYRIVRAERMSGSIPPGDIDAEGRVARP